MPAQIFLIAPDDADAASFAARLEPLLATTAVAALLLPRGSHGENDYKNLVKAVTPVAQQAGCAVLIEGDPGQVRTLGADGLHVGAATAGSVRSALAALKPDLIVGAEAGQTRHDAMSVGELGVDYVFFGPRHGPVDEDTAQRAAWWAETMEIPAVLSNPEAEPDTVDPHGCEFIGLSDSVWTVADDPDAALDRFSRALEAS